jgi:hypothetical protein
MASASAGTPRLGPLSALTRRRLLASAGASILGLALPAAAAAQPSLPSPQLIHRAACIRLGPGGPRLHVNRTHGNVGITRVGLTSTGDLVVYTDWTDGEQLIFAGCNVDLSLGAKGVTCGVSGGGPKSTIRLVDGTGLRRRANSSYFHIDVDNVWFQTISIAAPA